MHKERDGMATQDTDISSTKRNKIGVRLLAATFAFLNSAWPDKIRAAQAQITRDAKR